MKKSALFISVFFSCSLPVLAAEMTPMQEGIVAFEEKDWDQAMSKFMAVLKENPDNQKAHEYITLIAKQMELDRGAAVRQTRLQLLNDASQRLESNRMNSAPLENAILDTTQAEERTREERWHAQCEQARMERELGHLSLANDLVLKVLAENSSYAEAQRELSQLQTDLRQALDHGASLSMEERYTYEGFYAYGQADYSGALLAWQKVELLEDQSNPAEAAKRIQALHFSNYARVAQEHVDAEQREADLKTLFQRGLSLYEQKHFSEALDTFRQLAIREPDYPQLGNYIVQAESAAEKDRARRLGEEKREELAKWIQKGTEYLEHEQFDQARAAFQAALKLDPSHSQARSELAMVEAEMQRRHDPKAAQMHYEAGLIAYASGRLDEAMREWRLTVRMNPQHEKAVVALNKVQRELALSKDLP